MRIISKGADFSANNIGSSNRAVLFAEAVGITDASQIAALKVFNDSLKAASLISKLDAVKLFCFGYGKDGFNFIDVEKYNSTFVNDLEALHLGTSGYTPSGDSLSSARSQYYVTTFNMHMHVFNSTLETKTNGFLLAGQAAAAGADVYNTLQRVGNSTSTRAAIGSYTSLVQINATSLVTDTGLLSIARASNNKAVVYSQGVAVSEEVTQPGTAPLLQTTQIYEGSIDSSSAANFSGATIFATAYGRGDWSAQNEADFNASLDALYTALNS